MNYELEPWISGYEHLLFLKGLKFGSQHDKKAYNHLHLEL